MQRILAIILVSWVFVVSPALCLAGWNFGHGDRHEGSEPCSDTGERHECPHDPCHAKATIRPADDDDAPDLQPASLLFASVTPWSESPDLDHTGFVPAGIEISLGQSAASHCTPLLI